LLMLLPLAVSLFFFLSVIVLHFFNSLSLSLYFVIGLFLWCCFNFFLFLI
jgi:hypothetical protein